MKLKSEIPDDLPLKNSRTPAETVVLPAAGQRRLTNAQLSDLISILPSSRPGRLCAGSNRGGSK
jgi:hypothetical protein